MVKVCNNCKNENPDDAEFCGSCGENLVNAKSSTKLPRIVCSKCKNVSTNLWPEELCQNCGSSLESKTNQTLPKKQQPDADNTLPQTNQTLPEKKQTHPNNILPKKKSNNLLFIIPAVILIIIFAVFVIRVTQQTGSESQPPLPGAQQYFDRGMYNSNSEQYTKAIEDFTIAIELHPGGVTPAHPLAVKKFISDAYFSRGIVYYRLEQLDKALEDWDKALEINPNHPEAMRWRTQLLEEHPELSEAEYRKENQVPVSKLKPRATATSIPDSTHTPIPEPTSEPEPTPTPAPIKYYYYLNAEENMRNEQFSAALDNINKYIELNNNDPDGYFIRARAFQRSGSRQQSILDYDRAIELQPDNTKAYRYRANNYRELKQYERAIDDYIKSIQLDPTDENEWSYYFLADSYWETNHYEEAITNWERYAEIQLYKLNSKQSPYAKERLTDTHVSIGEAYRELGIFDMAMQNFQRALDITPFYKEAIKGTEKVNLLVESQPRSSKSNSNNQSSNKFGQVTKLTQKYEHKTAGFSISFPDEWDLIEHSDQTPPHGVLQDVDFVNRNNLIRLEVQQNNGLNLDQWQNTFIQDRWDFNINKTGKIDSLPAYLNHGTGMGPETDAAILLYANDKWLISIVFILEGMDADTYETIVDGMVDSIIFVNR